MNSVRSVSVSEARARLAALLDEVEGGEPLLIVSRSKVRAVLMDVSRYNALVERLEDLEDALEILQEKVEGVPARPLEEYLEERASRRPARVSGRP